MRPTRARAEEPERRKDESADERDERMEQAYNFDRRGERSTLAFVTTYRDELVEEFFAWRRQQGLEGLWTGEDVFAGLRRFERTRFGADLYVGAHGVLLFAVRVKLDPADGGRKIPPGYFDRRLAKGKGLPSKDPDALAAQAARGHRMPRTGQSRQERDEQLMRAQEQADRVRAEAEAEEAATARAAPAEEPVAE